MAWVYLRVDRHKPALAKLYKGPYCILQQTRNTALLQMGSKTKKVNLERLKPYVVLDTLCLLHLCLRSSYLGGDQ